MALHILFEKMVQKWKFILSLLLIGASLGFITSIVLPREYKTSFEVLIVQKQQSGMDLYTAAKTTEYVGKILSEVITSQTFRDTTFSTDKTINQAYFHTDPEKRKKQWKNMVKSRVLSSTGVVIIDVFHEQKDQSKKIAESLIQVLTQSGDIYLGGTYSEVKVIDAPLTTKWTVRPNIFTFSLMGALLGAFFSMMWIYWKNPLK